MIQAHLEFSFKGDRNYVHGTDVYRQIVWFLQSQGYTDWQFFEINVRKITSHNMTCLFADEPLPQEGAAVTFKVTRDQKSCYGVLIEDTNSEITSSYAFSDEAITRHCVIDDANGSFTYTNPTHEFAAIDVIVSTTRHYVSRNADDTVKWLFRRIQFLRPIDSIEFNTFRLQMKVQRRNIVEMDMYLDDRLIGYSVAASIKV